MAAKKKKKVTRRKSAESVELDAWIEREATRGKGCPLCVPEVKEELTRIERRLRAKKKRVSIRALRRWLVEHGLTDISDRRLSLKLQSKCHLKFYSYLKGLE